MNMYLVEQYNQVVNDKLTDGNGFKWKLHTSRMMNGKTYTKTTWLQFDRFRFDIEYHSDNQYFYIFCRYDNNSKDYTNATNKTITINQIKVSGNDNDTVTNAINEWKHKFIEEIGLIK